MKKTLLWLLPIFFLSSAYTYNTYITHQEINKFEKDFSICNINLESKHLNYYGVSSVITKLKNIHHFAYQCIQQKEDIISHIKYPDVNNTHDSATDTLAEAKRSRVVGELSRCQSLFFQTQNSIEYADKQLSLTKNFRHPNNSRPNIIEIFSSLKSIHLYSIHFKKPNEFFSLQLDRNQENLFIQYLFITIGFSFLIYALFYFLENKTHNKLAQNIFHHSKTILPLLIPAVTIHQYVLMTHEDNLLKPPVLIFLFNIVIYLSMIYVIPLFVECALFIKNNKLKKLILNRMYWIINTFFVLGNIRFILLNGLEHNSLEQLVVIFYIVCVNVLILYLWFRLLWVITNKEFYLKKHEQQLKWIKVIFTALFLISAFIKLTTVFLGYYEFSVNYLLFSIVLIVIFIRMIWLLKYFEAYIQSKNNPLSIKVFSFFGINTQQKIYEITIYRYLGTIYVSIYLFILVCKILGIPHHYIVSFRNFFFNPIIVGHTHFILIDLFHAIFMYCTIMLLGKFVARKVGELPNFINEIDLVATFKISIRYIAFSLAMIISFIILGLNITQITVLLGGIGLGLGMGMQPLVIDFISGIFILIQKNIHIGDYITLHSDSSKSTSGHVQKIMLFSIQLLTDNQSVLFIPNSMVMKGAIFNHTIYKDIDDCYLLFKFSSEEDLEKAKGIILKVSSNHKNIVQTPPHQPDLMIHPHSYKDANYMLHLSFSIIHINEKHTTFNELIKNINEELQKKKIYLIK